MINRCRTCGQNLLDPQAVQCLSCAQYAYGKSLDEDFAEKYTFYLQGDLDQMATQASALDLLKVPYVYKNVYPVIREKDVKKVLKSFFANKTKGWWHYKDEMKKHGWKDMDNLVDKAQAVMVDIKNKVPGDKAVNEFIDAAEEVLDKKFSDPPTVEDNKEIGEIFQHAVAKKKKVKEKEAPKKAPLLRRIRW